MYVYVRILSNEDIDALEEGRGSVSEKTGHLPTPSETVEAVDGIEETRTGAATVGERPRAMKDLQCRGAARRHGDKETDRPSPPRIRSGGG